jgi:hypothetical protein
MKLRITIAMTAAAAAALGTTSAGAVDETKPSVSCYGLAFTDKKGDMASTAPGAQPGGRENLDLLGAFYKYDAAKAEEATTINLLIANLTKDIPDGSTAVSWYVSYGSAAGDPWLRALTDFTGIVSYETGHYEIVGPQTQSVRDGGTTGAFFEGADGVIQIVYPADGPGKPGTVLKPATVTAYEARQVLPGASPTPAKGGLLYEVDSGVTKGTHTVGSPCPAGGTPAAPPPSTTPTTAPGSPTATQPLNTGGSAAGLPAKLVTTKVKAKQAKKSLKLKVSSTEALTQFGLQVRKGKKVFGKIAGKKVNGSATFKLKVSKLKKGTYTVDLAGTDAKGARRFAVAKLTVR